nr:hypothetical protein [uncultured Campylobacter sp.]
MFQSLKIGSVVSNSQKIINLEKFTSFYAIASEIIAYFYKKVRKSHFKF